MAARICDNRGEWVESNFSECASFSVSTLRNISKVACGGIAKCYSHNHILQLPLGPGNLPVITQGVFNAVDQARNSEDQSALNLEVIAREYRRLENCSATNEVI